jgi:hypothetical protein
VGNDHGITTMSLLKDNDGNDLMYWPIPALEEGEDSEVLTFKVQGPVAHGSLIADADTRVKVWARQGTSGPYSDIAINPLDLTALAPGLTVFQTYLEALSPIEGLQNIPIAVSAGIENAAAWTA